MILNSRFRGRICLSRAFHCSKFKIFVLMVAFFWIFLWFKAYFWLDNKLEVLNDLNNNNVIKLKRSFGVTRKMYVSKSNLNVIKKKKKEKISIDLLEDINIDLRREVELYNEQQIIWNQNSYGHLTNDSIVIVVQVHNRINNLRYLIKSLSQAANINEALVVFSHDVYDEDINELITSIKFCKVIQIFFPYSIQLYPNTFPGNDPNDCPRDIGKETALEMKCINAEYPDLHGRYRESQYTQIKHHWWWKANYVFNDLRITKTFAGLVTFLEEDYYVAEDFIYMLKKMRGKCQEISDCFFLGLGRQESSNIPTDSSQVQLRTIPTNSGLTFNRTVFNTILKCKHMFCEFDDYNWDWSITNIAQNCHKLILMSMISAVPRVYHTGVCGTHFSQEDCDEHEEILNIQNRLKIYKDQLYPKEIKVYFYRKKRKRISPYGGWGDLRDRELCKNMTMG